MIILAVDYGDVRTGVAVCDKFEILASPVGVIRETNPKRLARELAAIAKEKCAELIVVGLPKNMDGSSGFRAQASINFAALLESVCGLTVELRDERLSTAASEKLLNEVGTYGKKRRQVIDAVAAVMILQDYLDYGKK